MLPNVEILPQCCEHLMEGVALLDEHLKYVLWNSALRRLTGITADKAIGRHPQELFPTWLSDGTVANLKRLLTGEMISPVEVYYPPLTPDGPRHTAHIRPLHDSTGVPCGLMCLSPVTSNSPDANPSHSEGDERFRLFADSVMDYAMYTLDVAEHIASWNRGAERLFGYAAHEVLGRSDDAFYEPEARLRQDRRRDLALARERGQIDSECWRIRRDGGVIGAYVVITALRDAHGHPRGFAVVTRDITEHRRSVQELQDQKRRLRSIVETAVDAIVIIDERGIVESFNPAAERMFGYKADEVIGQNVNILMPQPFADEHTGYIQRYLRTGAAKIIGIGREIQARRKDGSLFPADLAVSEFYDGRPQFTGIVRDISERKAMEAEVLQIAEAEQRRIGQELHDDAQQQLSGLTMIARNAADSLAAHISNDPKLAEVHTKVERVVKGLREANQSLRELARGLVPLQIEAHGLHDALRKLAAQISEAHSVTCTFFVENGLDVHDDATASNLYRITQEAVNNALKHGAATQIVIQLRSVNGMAVLEITDNGVGISDPRESSGRGLQIMAHRARLIGAVMTVRKADPRGTIVSCALRP
ncbi:MAG TPA: PAS domain S-box protein [Planctomycetaceae bacterium]|jgi:PAS domain S-box-containing protein|nr:PAS domain S-box protein [Planctomycetaceae bacterium]